MAAVDLHANNKPGLTSPAEHAAVVTPSDADDLDYVTTGLIVGTGGDLEVVMWGGGTVVMPNIASGSVLPIRVSKVKAGSTTASDITALW